MISHGNAATEPQTCTHIHRHTPALFPAKQKGKQNDKRFRVTYLTWRSRTSLQHHSWPSLTESKPDLSRWPRSPRPPPSASQPTLAPPLSRFSAMSTRQEGGIDRVHKFGVSVQLLIFAFISILVFGIVILLLLFVFFHFEVYFIVFLLIVQIKLRPVPCSRKHVRARAIWLISGKVTKVRSRNNLFTAARR